MTDPYACGFEVKPALVLDLDQTIRYGKNDPKGFINGREDIAIYPDVEAKLWECKKEGFLVLGATNQGGVAYGHKTYEESVEEIDHTRTLFGRDPFDWIEDCPFMSGGNTEPFKHRSLLRKPEIGMLAVMEREMFERGVVIDWDASLMVGDRPEDEEFAGRAGIAFRHANEFFGRSS